MIKKDNTDALTWLSHTAGKKKWYVLSMALLQALLGMSSVLFALLFRSLVDRAMAGEKNLFFQTLLGMGILMLCQMALSALDYFLYEWSRSALENQFKEWLFSCLLGKDYASVMSVHSGEWMNRLTSDTVVVTNGIIDILPGLAGLVTRLVGALVAIFMLEPMFTYLLIPGGGLAIFLTYGFRKILKRLHKQIQEMDGNVRVYLQERLGNLMIVRTFAMEKRTMETAAEKMRQHRRARVRRNLFSNLCSTGFEAAADGLYLFGVGYCGYGILMGTVSYGTMMAVLKLIGQVQSPFANLTGYLPRYYAMLASAERLMEAERYPEDCEGEPVSEPEICRFYQEELQSIGLRRAAFTYHPPAHEKSDADGTSIGTVVLTGINLEIRKGEYVAFTGHSGCGKSTVLKLLMSLYPLDEGERYLVRKGSDGVETQEPLNARWRGLFAYVPQENQLMSGSIREIVAFGDREGMQKERQLRRALQIACADEFVDTLEDGIDTVLGERGSGLSEGQMQRIALARAIFSDHPVLMLDEATSALDEETEQKLLVNLKAMTDKTVLIVTHRAVVLRICDKQIVMTEEGGTVALQGRELRDEEAVRWKCSGDER